ncbi:E3 ubiquitin-protein ligase arkadia-like isoform X2 [Mangifera indica]|uniref:E3 ubiquitin-protein ligase arkadia-like isoform X2 n=1 Tax=Mangifera indica TaxID=29780 RepID=UPI001CFA4A5A|nr:E3 ubiquitin-protein ligase arkadia-like isoform X2 [Mangifera indica]
MRMYSIMCSRGLCVKDVVGFLGAFASNVSLCFCCHLLSFSPLCFGCLRFSSLQIRRIWILIPSLKVVILSLEPVAGLNKTKVVFAVDPDAKSSKISLYSQSLIKSSFVSFVIDQSFLRLTTSLFGDPFTFEVLKFPGGITVIPLQSAFPLQKVQILFRFTLNFSIYQIQVNFNELTSQLKSGLHLAAYENLYISLFNSKGSTVAPPTIVQSSVLLAVGSTPSTPRLKQLAQTITGSHSKNLGLNNTVFGRVKQVRLSSILQHSLNGGNGSGPSLSPSPAPLPHSHHHHHHHHHHHRHRHRNDHLAPASSPTPATQTAAPLPVHGSPAPRKNSPAPRKSHEAQPPGCHSVNNGGSRKKGRTQSHLAPTIPPSISPRRSATSPQALIAPPTPMPAAFSHSHSASSPLPNVVFAHVRPPSKSGSDVGHHDTTLPVSQSPFSSSEGHTTIRLAFSLLLAVVLHF